MADWDSQNEVKKICAITIGCTANGKVFPVRCKSWACEVCAPLNAFTRACECANGVNALRAAGLTLKFITLTQPGSVKTIQYAHSIISEQWTAFRARLLYWVECQMKPPSEKQIRAASRKPRPDWMRRCDEPAYDDLELFYAAFVEGQPERDQMPHFHIISSLCPKRWKLKRMAVKSGFGYQAHVDEMEPDSGVAWYVSKYSTKSSDASAYPKGFRRVRFSQNWPKLSRTSNQDDAIIVKHIDESIDAFAIRCAYTLKISPDSVIDAAIEIADAAKSSDKSRMLAEIFGQMYEYLALDENE